jgi:hypothetical protein
LILKKKELIISVTHMDPFVFSKYFQKYAIMILRQDYEAGKSGYYSYFKKLRFTHGKSFSQNQTLACDIGYSPRLLNSSQFTFSLHQNTFAPMRTPIMLETLPNRDI